MVRPGLLPRKTCSAAETRALAADLAQSLDSGSVVALRGDLGAGKTEFVRGMVGGLGGDEELVSSPTFTIAQEYEVEGGRVIHVDAYRVEDPREFVEMGMEEYLLEARLVAIEWPDRMGPLLPEDSRAIRIVHLPDGCREITPG